ncbi:MAG: thiamine phosphate synthase [Devosia sp.]|nr:thiamine phosphate synthase [Devosia sp.]
MSAQIFLIAPADAEPAEFVTTLTGILARSEVPALLLPRGERPEKAYKDFVKAVLPGAQAAGCAVLIEGEPGLVRTLRADGLHVTAGAKAVSEAIGVLKPDLIVGAGDIHSRDDAMTQGELGVDYILFGPLSGSISPAGREMARWWAQTMEVPSVFSDPEADAASYDAEGCEFIGLGAKRLETLP